ncbi:MAG: DNA-processing protein DprA [Clostridia bacterium]|nr:DNA-processing protein DprA [Clostridia bacterium]
MQKEMLFWIWLSEALGAGNRDFGRLIALYETPYDIFLAEEAELERISELSPRSVRALADKDLQRATKILDTCERQGIGILPYGDERYPKAFVDLKDPPILLYYTGCLPDLSRRLSIGMVGTRKMSEYGLRSAYKIAYELASAGVVIVSGMAAGIDGVCAAGALAAKGETVAVLGCGVDIVYPKHHKRLRDAIAQNGAVISEYPPGTRPTAYHFPTRNRLIAGLSQGTVVVEAGMGSGSLITAKVAVAQGKEVFALPANVGSVGAEGTNGLLRDGAHPILESEDVLEPYLYSYAEVIKPEVIRKIGNASLVNMQYLNELGVIELVASQKKTERSSDIKTVQNEPKQKEKTVRNRKPSERKTEKTVTEPKSEERKPDRRETPDETLASLSPVQLAVMQAIPDDHGITADALSSLEYPYQEVISALTMLEILGLVQKLPGAIYVKI